MLMWVDGAVVDLMDNVESLELSDATLRRAVSSMSLSSSSFDLEDDVSKKDPSLTMDAQPAHRCEEITVPMCRNMEYNMTSMPNQFNHETQQEAAAEAHQFWALVEFNCAKELRFFLCSMYTPICLPNYAQPVRACRSVCMRARHGCEGYMKKFGFEWPEHMNCDLFPEYGSSGEVCMDPMDAQEQQARTLIINHNLDTSLPPVIDPIELSEEQPIINATSLCQPPFIQVNRLDDLRSTGGVQNCIQPCKSVFFDQWEIEFTDYWILTWSCLCLFSSICTAFTFLIERKRFKYPEKPIVYLSICYFFVSVGYLLKYVVGREWMTCESADNSVKYSTDGSLNSLPCVLSFVFVYYFGMASSVWWIVISLTWFLAAGLKWSSEAILKYKVYFHLFAWLLPFFQTVIVLSMSLIDADSLGGICYVGNLSTFNLRMFVLLPASVYLLVGVTFLVAGFVSLFRIRNMIRRQQSAHKLEKLMIRIGIFSILYTVPATCVIACQFYENNYRSDWERAVLCSKTDPSCETTNRPEFVVFLLKYFMSLVIGVTSGFWIWTEKTFKSWSGCVSKSCAGHEEEEISSVDLKHQTDYERHSGGSFCVQLKSALNLHRQKTRRHDSRVYYQANGSEPGDMVAQQQQQAANLYDSLGLNVKYATNNYCLDVNQLKPVSALIYPTHVSDRDSYKMYNPTQLDNYLIANNGLVAYGHYGGVGGGVGGVNNKAMVNVTNTTTTGSSSSTSSLPSSILTLKR